LRNKILKVTKQTKFLRLLTHCSSYLRCFTKPSFWDYWRIVRLIYAALQKMNFATFRLLRYVIDFWSRNRQSATLKWENLVKQETKHIIIYS